MIIHHKLTQILIFLDPVKSLFTPSRTSKASGTTAFKIIFLWSQKIPYRNWALIELMKYLFLRIFFNCFIYSGLRYSHFWINALWILQFSKRTLTTLPINWTVLMLKKISLVLTRIKPIQYSTVVKSGDFLFIQTFNLKLLKLNKQNNFKT